MSGSISGPIPALVMAGGMAGPDFSAASGLPDAPGSRALAPIDGRPMVRYVLRALQAAETVGKVLVVAPPGFPEQPEADAHVSADEGLAENIRAGIQAAGDAPFVLIVTADIPFLTPQAVDDYVRQALAADADLCYAAIDRAACERQFPGMPRTYLRIGQNRFTGGNVAFQRVSAYERQMSVLQDAYKRRKSPLFLARLIGLGNVVRFLAGKLTFSDIEAASSRLMGVQCRLLTSSYAEIGTDVDRPTDLVMARERLKWETPESG